MKPSVTVLGIGPGAPEDMTLRAAALLREPGRTVILRTEQHPCAAWLRDQGIPFRSLDSFYDRYDDFDVLHAEMAAFLWEQAKAGPVVYAVPDPVSDRSVAELKKTAKAAKGSLDCVPGLSYADLYLTKSAKTADARQYAVVPSYELSAYPCDPSVTLLVTELNDRITAGEVKLFLSERFGDETPVCFLTLSPEDGSVESREIPLCELDRRKVIDHTSAVLVPGADYLHRSRYTVRDLELIMDRLRSFDGCPWDREQTHLSLRPYLVEEAWEAVSAIDEGDTDHLADELGDVLFQVIFHASIGKSFEEFTLTDIVGYICEKMIKRHPHVFGDVKVANAEEVSVAWEKIKRGETGSKTVGASLDDVSPALPSLKYAIKVNKKAQQLPAMKRDPAVIAGDIRELAASLLDGNSKLDERSLGDLLMKCTELCYRTGADAEIILHETVDRFKNCFLKAENRIFMDGKAPESLTNEELCVYLNYVEER